MSRGRGPSRGRASQTQNSSRPSSSSEKPSVGTVRRERGQGTRGTPNRGGTTRGGRGGSQKPNSAKSNIPNHKTFGNNQAQNARGGCAREEEVVVTEVATRPPEGARGVNVVQISQVHLPIRNPHHNTSPEVVEEDQEVAGVVVDQEEGGVEEDQENVAEVVVKEVLRDGPNRMFMSNQNLMYYIGKIQNH